MWVCTYIHTLTPTVPPTYTRLPPQSLPCHIMVNILKKYGKRIGFSQANQEFPESTCCQEKKRKKIDSVSSQLSRVGRWCLPIGWLVRLLKPGPYLPSASVCAPFTRSSCLSQGRKCMQRLGADKRTERHKPSVLDLPGHLIKKSQRGVGQHRGELTSAFSGIASFIY